MTSARLTRRVRLTITALLIAGPCVAKASEAGTCTSEPALARLDFWLGEWDVCSFGHRVGRNRVTKILGGCAVTEEWADRDGSSGISLFYYIPLEKTWKQVWVTEHALYPGGLKEKRLVAIFPDRGVRFQGELSLPDGRRILDRTTLRPGANETVHQKIEISSDGGESWSPTFDAEYRARRVAAETGETLEGACQGQ